MHKSGAFVSYLDFLEMFDSSPLLYPLYAMHAHDS